MSDPSSRLCVLAFDHRESLKRLLSNDTDLQPTPPALRAAKELVVEALLDVHGDQPAHRQVGLLIDEEFGGQTASVARAAGVTLIMPIERSGVDGFDPLDEALWEATLARDPHHVKVLVRVNPERDTAHLAAVHRRVRHACERLADRSVLLELLIPPLPEQLELVGGERDRYDREMRPALTGRQIDLLYGEGVHPALWKLEGFEDAQAARGVIGHVRGDGRGRSGCLVLGRGADAARVDHWLRVAAAVDGFDGFAIGRSIWWAPLRDHLNGKTSRRACLDAIGRGFHHCCELFDAAAAEPASTRG